MRYRRVAAIPAACAFAGALIVAVACGDDLVVGAVSAVDGSPADAAIADAVETTDADAQGNRCSTFDPFLHVAPIVELDTDADEQLPRLSRDEQSIYFFRSDLDASTHVFVASRPAPGAPFGTPTQILPSVANPYAAAPSGDDRRLYLNAGLDTGALLLAERTSKADSFDNFTTLGDGGGDVFYEEPALMEPPGAPPRLFVSLYSSVAPDPDLWSAVVDEAGTPGTFAPVDGVNVGSSAEYYPTPSTDGLTLYFYSERDARDGPLHGRIHVAHRPTPDGPFTTVGSVDEIVRPPNGWVGPGYLSVDQCRLYYFAAQDVTGPADLFVATRDPG